MNKNNTCKNKVSLKKIFYDDNKVDSIVPLENDIDNQKIDTFQYSTE